MYIPWDELEMPFSSTAKHSKQDSFEQLNAQMKILRDWWAIARWHNHLRAFQPKVRIFIEKENYVIKTVESSWELAAALRLRHEVFFQELLGTPMAAGFDMDEFDMACDHLVIIDKKTRLTVGTYRLLSSRFTSRFYSAQEFDISGILALPGHKLELGRACIHHNFRNGLVMALLWRGVTQYIQEVGAKYLFGCSSIHTTNLDVAAQIGAYVRRNAYTVNELDLFPHPSYQIPEFSAITARYEALPPTALESARKMIPPLLLSYLRSGARVGIEPALDKVFRCIDFITILDTEKLTNAYAKKFMKC